MHENVNDYADDLIKLFFKQTVSKDLSIGKSAHTHFCFKHMAWTLKATSFLQLCLVSAVRVVWFWGGRGNHEAENPLLLPVLALGDNPTPLPPPTAAHFLTMALGPISSLEGEVGGGGEKDRSLQRYPPNIQFLETQGFLE